MPPSFQDKVILITGAGSGIGRGTAIKLSSLGATLALSDINASSLAETLSLCTPGSHSTSGFDVGSTSAVNSHIEEVMKIHGQINHIFNCAGINPTTLATETITDEYWNRLMNTNIKGMFNVTRACIPHLSSGASFVNVSSICGLGPSAGFAVYCASKYAVIGFSKCMALELGPKGVRTNVVAPGFIDTPTNASVVLGKESVERMRSGISLGRVGMPEDVADVVAFLFGEESRYMNGSVVEVTGGIV